MDDLLAEQSEERFYVQVYADDGLIIVIGRKLVAYIRDISVNMILSFAAPQNENFAEPQMCGLPLALAQKFKYLGAVIND